MAIELNASVDPERLALSWCFLNNDITPLIHQDVLLEDIEDKEHHKIYEWALEHYREYASSPGLDALRLHNPNWRVVTPTDHVDVYIADIKKRIRYNVARDIVQVATGFLTKDDDDGAVAEIIRGASDLSATTASAQDEDITLEPFPRYDFYDDLRRNPGALRGMATGFHTIDRATGGVQPGQFIVLVGIQKSGKSFSLMVMGKSFNEQGKRGLLVSFEMSAEEQKARWDSIWAGVNYRKFTDGRADRNDMAKLKKAMQKMNDGYPFIMTTDIARTTTVSGIAAKMAMHSPDVVLVDGMYLMMDDYGEAPGSPQALTNITRDFKRLAQRTKIPIIGTTQASEAKTTRSRGVTVSSVSWSQSFGQDADVLIGLQPPNEEDDKPAEMRVLASRHGPLVRSELEWSFDTMTFAELYGDDLNGGPVSDGAGGY